MNYYTSDLHFGRVTTFKIEGRDKNPDFADETGEITIEKMGEKIIQNINNKVSAEDTLYILGDCSSVSHDPTDELMQIKAHKILIIGNHDKKWLNHRHFKKCFDDIKAIETIRDGGTKIVLCHYPMADWENSQNGYWHLYGHIHERADIPARNFMKNLPHCYNVGVDSNNFQPLTLAEIFDKSGCTGRKKE